MAVRYLLLGNILLIALTATLLTGCRGSRSTTSTSGESPLNGSLSIKGSDTMLPLVSAWSEAYMDQHARVNVSATGGGTGTGIAALINGTTDICAASREVTPEETQTAKAKGITPTETVVARDGIAMIVNPKNPLNDVTLEQLRKIYTGTYTSWKQVGGPDNKIIVLSRESSSGTYVFFQEHVLKKADYAASVRLLPATSAIIQAVESDQWAIGYVGLGYAAEAGNKVKVLQVKADAAAPAVTPSEATVRSGEYSIARPLYFYTNGEPTGLAQSFIAFCLGPAGQQLVNDNGYVTVQ